MNVKLHTPKSLKAGSGTATLKQFLLSLVATTISIVLTFGTAGWLDSRKKEAVKHEMVMTILYDISSSIEKMEAVDSLLRNGFEQQVKVIENPELMKQNPFMFVSMVPEMQYSESVENIFSSNIETIDIIGNILFSENVSQIYNIRKKYRDEVVEKLRKEFMKSGISSYEGIRDLDFVTHLSIGSYYLADAKERMNVCKQMMDISDEELDAYSKKREMLFDKSRTDSITKAIDAEMLERLMRLNDAKK